ncbi:MAG: UDP-glucose 4-epimerase GalE [Mobilitalea sp.]
MKILVTGATGYIGSHACVGLLKNGYEVIGIDNFSNSDPSVVNKVSHITGKEFYFYECDLRTKEQVNDIFEENKIDAVMHFAASKSVPESVGKPLLYYHNNILSTINLLEVMKQHNVKKLVFSSSATVYGINNMVPLTEEMALSATNPYGWTKVMIEQILSDYANSDQEVKVAILRYFNPIGADPSGFIGDKPRGIPSNLMPYLCLTAVGKLPSVKVCGTDYPTKDGTGVRDYIHITDLVEGHKKALEKLDNIKGAQAYNLGTGIGYTVLELIDTFEKVSGLQIKRELQDRRPGDVSEVFADVGKAERELGWKAKLTLEDMCRDSYNFIKMNT